MLNPFHDWRKSLHWLLPGVGCLLIGWACLTVWRHNYAPGNIQVTASAGSSATRRYQLASILANYAVDNGLDMQLVDSVGSEETLQLVDAGEIDVGLVSGGFVQQNHPNVRQLATIGPEPMHLLVKSNLVANAHCDLAVLKNLRVNLGSPGSGTYALATEILEFCDLHPQDAQGKGDYIPCYINNDELIERARAIRTAPSARAAELIAELPDAVFMLNPLPSRVAKGLVTAANYKLLPLPFCQSFRINNLQHLGNQPSRIDRRQVTPTVIPASSYRAINSVPEEDCETLGVPLIVVARAGLSSTAAKRLIATLYESQFANEMPPADLLSSTTAYPLHAAVTPFLVRRKPVAMRDLVDVMQKLLSVFGAFSAGVLAVLSFYRRRKTKSASVYVSEIGQIERLSWDQSTVPGDPSAAEDQQRIIHLEEQLAQLKQRIINDYAVGQFTGEAAFANLMTLISDTRMSLKRTSSSAQESPTFRLIPRKRPIAASSSPTAIKRSA